MTVQQTGVEEVYKGKRCENVIEEQEDQSHQETACFGANMVKTVTAQLPVRMT